MPRPPKNKLIEPPKPVAPAPAPAPVMIPVIPAPPTSKVGPVIDVDNFIRVRDSVYQRLSTIQDLIKSFSQDYLRQTNLLLGEGTNIEGVDFDQFGFGQLAQFGSLLPAVEEKKERKKRTHDPNAPKRPLTPYFLYMQTARPIIAKDLGEDAPKRAVQEEGQRRWAVMTGAEKNGWNQAYQYNLRLYNARVHSYKHGNPEAKSMNDAEALQYAEEFNIEMPSPKEVEEVGANEEDAIAQQLGEAAAVDEASEEEPTPITKTPKKPAARKPRKTATPAAAEAAVPSPPKPAATPASPEAKKRKRTSKVADLVEEPKKSGRKKTKSG